MRGDRVHESTLPAPPTSKDTYGEPRLTVLDDLGKGTSDLSETESWLSRRDIEQYVPDERRTTIGQCIGKYACIPHCRPQHRS
jgi:hypothetical protein